MTDWLPFIIATVGTLAALGAWGFCRWLDRRMDRDDDKDKGIF